MITYTEFFLFVALIIAVFYALHWRFEAHRVSHLFKLMLTNSEAREDIVNGYQEFLKEKS
jgi:hypothetical protein